MSQLPLIERAGAPALFGIEFSVPGTPVPQGSKTAQILGKRIKTKLGPAVLRPKVLLTELANMSTKTLGRDRLDKWRSKVADAAAAMNGREPTERPVSLGMEFVFQRPPSHYTSKGALTKSARTKIPPIDLSKLVRAIEDAITGVAFKDDRQVREYGPAFKRYGTAGKSPGVNVWVWEVTCLE